MRIWPFGPGFGANADFSRLSCQVPTRGSGASAAMTVSGCATAIDDASKAVRASRIIRWPPGYGGFLDSTMRLYGHSSKSRRSSAVRRLLGVLGELGHIVGH